MKPPNSNPLRGWEWWYISQSNWNWGWFGIYLIRKLIICCNNVNSVWIFLTRFANIWQFPYLSFLTIRFYQHLYLKFSFDFFSFQLQKKKSNLTDGSFSLDFLESMKKRKVCFLLMLEMRTKVQLIIIDKILFPVYISRILLLIMVGLASSLYCSLCFLFCFCCCFYFPAFRE